MAIAYSGDKTEAGFSATTDWTVTKPANCVSGDVLWAFFITDVATTATLTPPSGWVAANSQPASAASRLYRTYKVLDGSEGSTLAFAFDAARTGAVLVARLTGVDGTSPSTSDSGSSDNGMETIHPQPAIVADEAGQFALAGIAAEYAAGVSPDWAFDTGWTEIADFRQQGCSIGVAWREASGAGSLNGDVTSEDSVLAAHMATLFNPDAGGGGGEGVPVILLGGM